MTYQCKFCDCILASEYSLLNHQKTAKKCLIKRGILDVGSFKCDVCKDTFLCKSVLKKHIVSCSKKGFQLLKNLTYKDIHQVKFLFINIYKGIHFNFDLKTKTYI
jgi:hypothetical protein